MSLKNELSLDMPFSDIRHEAVLSIVRTANLLSLTGASLFRKFNLTEAQFNVLLILKYADHDLTQSDLSKRLVVTRASVTSVLDRLEKKGLVKRSNVPGNRRIYHVSLTSIGMDLIEKVEPQYLELVHVVTSELSESSCKSMMKQLERVRSSILIGENRST